MMVQALESFAPFERTETLGVRVREQLRHAIMAGLFKPGEKLTLRAVAASLGVSLTPAREALFNLAAEGVLELGETNGSIYVPRLDEEKLRELMKVRVSLEGLAAREATPNLKPKDII
jgi:DNA-binding GntR family transcriptional regulator